MKKTILFLAAVLGSGLVMAQDYGKIVIRNRDNTYPKFIASLNGVRAGNTYDAHVKFDYLDEKNYKIKITQEGNNYPLVFNLGNTLKYQTNYVLNKDEFGNYNLASEGKVLFTLKDETVSSAANDNITGVSVVTNVSTPPSSGQNNSNLGNATNITADPKALSTAGSMANSTNVTSPVIATGPAYMDNNRYTDIFNSIKKESVDNNKMTTAKTFITETSLSSEQVLGLVKLFSFENNRLSFAKWAYHKTIDRQNYIKVYEALTFSSSKKDLAEYIKKNP